MLRTRLNLALMTLSIDLPALITEAVFLVHHTSAHAHIDRIGRVSFAYFPALLLANMLLYRTWDRLPAPATPPGAGPLLTPESLTRGSRLDILFSYVVGTFLCSAASLAMIAMEWRLGDDGALVSDQFKLSLAGICLGMLSVWRARRLQLTGRQPRGISVQN